ncbi:hexokinase-4-like [Penaeus chinensis]|uniref:hexokinase-4-like n=1 Tax=Penaeus chinensis TaxID=139456 RepID=UPI001FB75F77|nr:hexokinase-4-like [Penaeus chinensis]
MEPASASLQASFRHYQTNKRVLQHSLKMSSMTEFPLLCIPDEHKNEKVKQLLAPLVLTKSQQQKVCNVFLDEMHLGLASNPEKKSSLLMENTFIPELPDGTENGEYMALDLGGTNFRVIYVQMKNGSITEEIVDYYHVPEERRLGPGPELFDYLAECIGNFMKKRKLGGRNLQLAMRFPHGKCPSRPLAYL